MPKWHASSSVLIPILVILADVNAMPSHISKPLLERIRYFHSLGRAKPIPATCVKPSGRALERSERVQASFCVIFMASHDGLEGLLVLPK